MIFNSYNFLFLFLPLVFGLYWFVFNKNRRAQIILLLLAGYVFYGAWDWRFTSLLMLSTIVDYCVGVFLSKTEEAKKRKFLLMFSLIVNLGVLGLFKYFNFFTDSFQDLMAMFGMEVDFFTINLLLPVGISFYTFQTLSYTIDVYRNKTPVCKDFLLFAVFVSYFPQLVAGPIERANKLIPQIKAPVKFNRTQAEDGLKLVLWGLFQKVVVADSCGVIVDEVYANHENLSGSYLFFGHLLFLFQAYGDFAGYSNIAVGTSKLLGIELTMNFNYPYFSRSISEFWKRWHITFGNWFKDYVFIPLGGNRGSKGKTIRNIFIIFFLSGVWHGAAWTYILSLTLFGLYYVYPTFKRKPKRDDIASTKDIGAILLTLFIFYVHMILFRSETLLKAWEMMTYIPLKWDFNFPMEYLPQLLLGLALLIFEWRHRRKTNPLKDLKLVFPIRWGFYSLLTLMILENLGRPTPYMYFQF